MQVLIENEYEGTDLSEILNFDYHETAVKVVSQVLSDCACPYEAEVNILFTGLSEIRQINKETRGIDKPTDVLSFPMHAYDTPADFTSLDPDSYDDFDPESGELMLGDIVLCIPKILSQSEEYGHSTLREYAFLIAHSILHLVGFDHLNEEESAAMFARQETSLAKLGITRN